MVGLGHVVMCARDLEHSLALHHNAVDHGATACICRGRATTLSGDGTPHERISIGIGVAPDVPHGRRVDIHHTGWRIVDSWEALRGAHRRNVGAGCAFNDIADHTAGRSIYLHEPDGNASEDQNDGPTADCRDLGGCTSEPAKPLSLD